MPKRKCSNIDASVGLRMRYYRIQCGLTQQQVADALKINRTTYTKYETGVSEPSHELLGKIVKMFGIDYNAILDNRDYFERRVADGDMTFNVLTLSERAIIARYRSMSKEDQKKICEYIDMLYNEKSKEDFVKNTLLFDCDCDNIKQMTVSRNREYAVCRIFTALP